MTKSIQENFLPMSKLKMYWDYTVIKLSTAGGDVNQIFITALNIKGKNMFNNNLYT